MWDAMAELHLTSDPAGVHLAVRGPLDRHGVDALRTALIEHARPGRVDLDLREVTSFPRLGIAVLVAARHRFGDGLRIHGTPEVLALVEDAGLSRLLDCGA